MRKGQILHLSIAAITILACCMLFLAGGGKVFAADVSSTHHFTKITVQMHIVGHATSANAVTPLSVSPQGTTEGDCGTIEFYVDDYGYGDAGFWILVSSTQGPILGLSYSVNWTNWSRSTNGSFGNSYGPVGNPWYIEPSVYTNTGFVTGSVSASDWVGLNWCQGYENDSATIT